MATLIPNIELTDFNALSAEQLKRLQCCEVFSGEEYLFTFIRPNTEYLRARSEDAGQLSNSIGGEALSCVTHAISASSMPSRTTCTEEPELYISDKPYKSKRKKKK